MNQDKTAPGLRRRWAIHFLRLWHAGIAGGFLVAYLTGDEDTYRMHQFSGYLVLAMLALRLAAGIGAAQGHPLALPRPSRAGLLQGLRQTQGRHPLLAWIAAALLATLGAVTLTGAAADYVHFFEKLHEAVAEASPWVIGLHVVFVAYIYEFRHGLGHWWNAFRRLGRPLLTLLLASTLLPSPAPAAEPAAAARALRLSELAAEAAAASPEFTGFSAERGAVLFGKAWALGDPRTAGCTACHGMDPREPGRNTKTGRSIPPMAVSAKPDRYTDPDSLNKHFTRDCLSVLGRPCTARERGDFITFMSKP